MNSGVRPWRAGPRSGVILRAWRAFPVIAVSQAYGTLPARAWTTWSVATESPAKSGETLGSFPGQSYLGPEDSVNPLFEDLRHEPTDEEVGEAEGGACRQAEEPFTLTQVIDGHFHV